MGCGFKGADARSLSVWLLLGSSPLLKRGIPSLICNVYYQETCQAIVISRVKIIRIVKKKYLTYLCLSTPLCLLHLNVARSVPGLSLLLFLTDNDMGDHCWHWPGDMVTLEQREVASHNTEVWNFRICISGILSRKLVALEWIWHWFKGLCALREFSIQ
jgi:hypothetical protein